MAQMAVKKYYFTDGASNRIFEVQAPYSIITFCEFDFSKFLHKSATLYDALFQDEFANLREIKPLKKTLCDAHPYIKNNIDTIFDKIVIDSWIHLLSSRNSIPSKKLWYSFINPKTPVEKAIFERLCDFRYKRSINHWSNIVGIQEYALSKIQFIFGEKENDFSEIKAKRSYFNLAMGLSAREMGVNMDNIGKVEVREFASLPNAPFILPVLAKNIMRDSLSNFDYEQDLGDIDNVTSELSDEKMLLAFSQIKDSLPQNIVHLNNVRRNFLSYPEKVYITDSFRALVDFEIDSAILEGIKINKCERCLKLFSADKSDSSPYCERLENHHSKSCRKVMETPKSSIDNNDRGEGFYKFAQRSDRCTNVIAKMRARVGTQMNIKEFTEWYGYFCALQDNIVKKTSQPEELEEFLAYSEKLLELDDKFEFKSDDIAKDNSQEKQEVKAFNPPRISKEKAQDISKNLESVPFSEVNAKTAKVFINRNIPKPEQEPSPVKQRNSAALLAYKNAKSTLDSSEINELPDVNEDVIVNKIENISLQKEDVEHKNLNDASHDYAESVINDKRAKAQASSKTSRLLNELVNTKHDNPIMKFNIQQKQRENAKIK